MGYGSVIEVYGANNWMDIEKDLNAPPLPDDGSGYPDFPQFISYQGKKLSLENFEWVDEMVWGEAIEKDYDGVLLHTNMQGLFLQAHPDHPFDVGRIHRWILRKFIPGNFWIAASEAPLLPRRYGRGCWAFLVWSGEGSVFELPWGGGSFNVENTIYRSLL
jgi:hypothetical protein